MVNCARPAIILVVLALLTTTASANEASDFNHALEKARARLDQFRAQQAGALRDSTSLESTFSHHNNRRPQEYMVDEFEARVLVADAVEEGASSSAGQRASVANIIISFLVGDDCGLFGTGRSQQQACEPWLVLGHLPFRSTRQARVSADSKTLAVAGPVQAGEAWRAAAAGQPLRALPAELAAGQQAFAGTYGQPPADLVVGADVSADVLLEAAAGALRLGGDGRHVSTALAWATDRMQGFGEFRVAQLLAPALRLHLNASAAAPAGPAVATSR